MREQVAECKALWKRLRMSTEGGDKAMRDCGTFKEDLAVIHVLFWTTGTEQRMARSASTWGVGGRRRGPTQRVGTRHSLFAGSCGAQRALSRSPIDYSAKSQLVEETSSVPLWVGTRVLDADPVVTEADAEECLLAASRLAFTEADPSLPTGR